ncbi:MAG: DUF4231 domain-containing protein [Acidimicrobiales bacterium]
MTAEPAPGPSGRTAMLRSWRNGIQIMHRSHAQSATAFTRRARLLAVTTLVLSTIVGTSIFSSIDAEQSTGWKVATGLVSLASAVFAALQAFLNYPDLAERHRQSSLRYGTLRRRLDLLTTRPGHEGDDEELKAIRTQWDEIVETAPVVPQGIHRRVEREVLARNQDRPAELPDA